MYEAEAVIKSYYDSRKEIEILKHEISVIENNNKRLEECKDKILLSNPDEIKNIIEENEKKIVDKQIKLNDIVVKYAAIEYLINSMDQESQKILELRYKKEKPLQAISMNLNMSKSTVSRRSLRIIDKIARELVLN